MMSAQTIGGLNSSISLVEQMMDVRDVLGTLYRINKQGYFATEERIDRGTLSSIWNVSDE